MRYEGDGPSTPSDRSLRRKTRERALAFAIGGAVLYLAVIAVGVYAWKDNTEPKEPAKTTIDHTQFRELEVRSLANLMMASNPTLYRRLAMEYAHILNRACMSEGVGDVTLLTCMMIRESRCRYDARSRVGAQGLMQVMPFWTKEFEKWGLPYKEQSDIYDPEVNIRAGVAIFARCLKTAKGDLFKALCYYNAGYRDNGSAGIPYARSIMAMFAKAGE